MGTVIDFRTLNTRFCTSLVFAAFEGLRDGEMLKVVSGEEPLDLEKQFKEANISNAHLKVVQPAAEVWELNIYKMDKNKVGCCGVCGS
ncbi:MAG: DUF2249 domain-containing protein [Bdellovibrionales bacterium]|nr:DUF2249 domain-containing protein [Bdellovibrionales bacterium]